MKTMFTVVPFGKENFQSRLGLPLGPTAPGALPPQHWEQVKQQEDELSGPRMGQDLDDLGFLSDAIGELLNQVPSELLGAYQDEYDRCVSILDTGVIGLPSGMRCLRDLYFELQDVVKSGKTPTAPTTTPTPTPPAPAPPSEFPWIPVGIAVAGGGLLIYFLTRGK